MINEEDRKEIENITNEVIKNFIENIFPNAIRKLIGEEVPEIIDNKITEFALKIPSIISRLVMESASKAKMYKEFVDKNSFVKTMNPGLFAETMMETEAKNTGKDFSFILEETGRILKERQGILNKIDLNIPNKPKKEDLKYEVADNMKMDEGGLGEL